MHIRKVFPWILFITVSVAVGSCKKQQTNYEQTSLTVTLPGLKLKHDLYYSIPSSDRLIEIKFSEELDMATVPGNIRFTDNSGSLNQAVDFNVIGNIVLVLFHPEFQLKSGWQYFLEIAPGLRSVTGSGFPDGAGFQLRTFAKHPNTGGVGSGQDTTRISLAVISDIHMGLAKANELKYCWFGQNNEALADFLEFISTGNQVRQVLILGDLFDEWIVPYSFSPFDPQAGINNTSDYFHAVAENPVNQQVVAGLRAIAQDPGIELIYVHGNHDMLLTREILQDIIPGINWQSDTTGLGSYEPASGIILEHGHRYDFFNCPQPLTIPGHILPPGYFVSRLYAQGTMDHPGLLKSANETRGDFEFLAAWEIAYFNTIFSLKMTPPNLHEKNILMGGIDNYTDTFSFNGIRDSYASNIEELWDQTQIRNHVPYHMACCFLAIWNGHSDLFTSAMLEYLDPLTAPKPYQVVCFGHTHEPMLEVYMDGPAYTGVYANSGSWVDKDQTDYDVRTYLIITPGAWSGSSLDVISLYQYNLEAGTGKPGNQYTPVLIAEESIEAITKDEGRRTKDERQEY